MTARTGEARKLAPTKTSADARRRVMSPIRARALSFINDESREYETGGDHLSALVSLLMSVWEEAYEEALSMPSENVPRPSDALTREERLAAAHGHIIEACAPDVDGTYDRERQLWEVEQIARCALSPRSKYVPYPGPRPSEAVNECGAEVQYVCNKPEGHGGSHERTNLRPPEARPGDPTVRHVVAWMRATYPHNQHAREWANEIARVFLGGPDLRTEPAPLGAFRPRPDIAWRDLKAAVSALSSSSQSEGSNG